MLLLLSACVAQGPGWASREGEGASARSLASAAASETAAPVIRNGHVWVPGSEVPGWEDYPCEDITSDYVDMTSTPDQVERARQDIDSTNWGGRVGEYPMYNELGFWACRTGESCSEENFFFLRSFGSHPPIAAERGQGWYEPSPGCSASSRSAYQSAETSFWPPYVKTAECFSYWDDIKAETHLCYSRVRPDEVSGVFWIRPLRWDEGGLADDEDSYWVKVSFTYDPYAECVLHAESGFDNFWDRTGRCREDEEGASHTYKFAYLRRHTWADVWPWESITDPEVREALYEVYRPKGETDGRGSWGADTGAP